MTNVFLRTTGHQMAFGSLRTWLHLYRKHDIPPQYFLKVFFITLGSVSSAPLRLAERALYKRAIESTAIEDDPVFIIGHWRSGTTYLHQLMAGDSQFGYVTLYQTLAPGMFTTGKWTVKPVLQAIAPKQRPGDSLEIPLDGPQEEEFALANMTPNAFYHHWSYPLDQREYFEKFVLMQGLSSEEDADFRHIYRYTLQNATRHMPGKQLVLKSPPNTGRIPMLLEMFPNARFIYIYRNPYAVFPSTLKYYRGVHEILRLQPVTQAALEDDIFYFYNALLDKFDADSNLIPADRLVTVRFETLMDDPVGEIRRIYDVLGITGIAQREPALRQEIASKSSHRQNRFAYDPELVEKVEAHWGRRIKAWGYDVPGVS